MTGRTTAYRAPPRAHLGPLLALAVLAGSSTALAIPAQTYHSGPLQFETRGQSMWGPGTATVIDKNFFLGSTWDEELTIGPGIGGGVVDTTIPVPHVHLPSGFECHGFLCSGGHFHNPGGIHIHHVPGPTVDTRTGGEVILSTEGRAGFDLNLQFDSGSVDASVQFDAQALLPDPVATGVGDFFSLNPSSDLLAGSLATRSPEASARLDAVLGVRSNLFGQVCFIALGCASGDTDIGFPDQSLELVSFNDSDTPGQIKILGVADPAAFQFDNEINIPGAVPGSSLGGVTVHVPDIDTNGTLDNGTIAAGGADDLLTVTADLDGLLLAPLGLPGLGVSVDVGIFSGSVDLVDVDLGPVLTVFQQFELAPELQAHLAFDRPVTVAGDPNPVTEVSGPWNALPAIALIDDETIVTPTFSVNGLFSNDTGFGVDGLFRLDVLKAALSLQAFGLSLNLAEAGPLFQILKQSNLFNLPPIFSSDYQLAGFNQQTTDPFLIDLSVAEENVQVELTAGSPVGIGQQVPNPGATFSLGFDYLFESGLGTLQVFLADELLVTLGAPGIPQGGFDSFFMSFDLGSALAGALLDLRFIFDAPHGSVLLLDNILFNGLSNGDFSDGLQAWTDLRLGGRVAAGTSAELAAPEPTSLALLAIALAGLGLRRRRRV